MSDMSMPVSNEKEKPTCRVCVSKDEAAKMKVGSSVTLEVAGEVKSLHPSYDDKSMYEVEIENPAVTVDSSEEDKKDNENMATMPREKLKAKIKKPSEDGE